MLYPVKLQAQTIIKKYNFLYIHFYNSFNNGYKRVLKTEISVTTVDDIAYFLIENTAKTVAVCNANTLVRAYRNLEIKQLVDSFDVKTPDGFPVAKSLKILMKNNQKRVDGFNLFHKTIKHGLEKNISHYFFGNNEQIVFSMINKLKDLYPGINIAGFYCPPLTETEKLTDNEYIKDLLKSDPDIVWVSLGFQNKKTLFITLKMHQVRSNFVGVGAVFEWVAGTKVKAPEWLADFGLEWIFRLVRSKKVI